MNSTTRIALILGVVVVLGGYVLLSANGRKGTTPTASPTVAQSPSSETSTSSVSPAPTTGTAASPKASSTPQSAAQEAKDVSDLQKELDNITIESDFSTLVN